MLTEFTGRWEDLVSRTEFRGHRVRIAIVDQPPAATDADKWVESLRQMAAGGVRVATAADDSRESVYEGAE
jgi:hypothetical protein